MKILIVDDRPEMAEILEDAVRDTNKDVEIVVADSYQDLIANLFTQKFDAAIIDYNFEGYEPIISNFLSKKVYENGQKIYDLFGKINHIESNNKTVLFSASEDIESLKGRYFVYDKISSDIDWYDTFQEDVLKKILHQKRDFSKITLNEISNYSQSRRIHFYKNFSRFEKMQTRFDEFEVDGIFWSTDIKDTNGKFWMNFSENLPEFNKSFNICEYFKLDLLINETEKIPNIFWNLNSKELLHIQTEKIKGNYLQNNFILDFFDVAYSTTISKKILENVHTISKFNEYLELLKGHRPLCLREAQCNIIKQLCIDGRNKSDILNITDHISNKTGLEIIDYYDGVLDEFDIEKDIAYVELISKIDKSICFRREFSYDRLKKCGIQYKESMFHYGIAESQEEAIPYGFIEPK